MSHSPSNTQKEINLIYSQIYISILSILVIIISIVLLYNEKTYLKKEKPILSPKATKYTSIFNRALALFTGLAFLYINYELYNISKEEDEDLKTYKYQILASFLTVIAAIIVLYVSTTSTTDSVSDVENPVI
ncbi:MAG: hypothetical protein NC181_04760 [Clostridium sp.]|nr:hypothetical protein [Clostridium sp.]MCM1444598.1 hypothetical protein [Candidatus Amulumruptor caecigallinarius]